MAALEVVVAHEAVEIALDVVYVATTSAALHASLVSDTDRAT